jgi:hypothetical protein
MQPTPLATQLREDARNEVPPFGAESGRIARQLGTAATATLVEHIDARGDTAFLALEALREADPGAYDRIPAEERAEIYVNALSHNLFYNAWGLPRYALTATADALISLGDEAVRTLQPLLSDRREAPLSGSEDATTSTRYANRVCDYAWVFISEIKQRPYTYAESPSVRDAEIARLQRELEGTRSPGSQTSDETSDRR